MPTYKSRRAIGRVAVARESGGSTGGQNSRGLNHSVTLTREWTSRNWPCSSPQNDDSPCGPAVVGHRYVNIRPASARVSDRKGTQASVTAMKVMSTAVAPTHGRLRAGERLKAS